MTDSHPNEETARRTEAESTREAVAKDEEIDGDDRSEPSATGSLSRRGALAVLTALGLGSVATGEASAASGDHLGELWDGSPGTGRGLETVLREKGQALKGTAGTNTDDTNDIGVKGTTYSNRGIGLEGLAAADSGNTIGLKGRTDSPDGTALFGEARNANPGSSLAVEGLSRAEDGTAIRGHAEANGATIGVEGRVNSVDGYGLSTPDDARIEGTVDTNETDFIVDAGTQSTGAARNVVAGHTSNAARDGAVGTTIAGGGYDDGLLTNANETFDNFGTIGGGQANQAGTDDGDPASAEFATVGGGGGNTASSEDSTVGGGIGNTASALQSTVAGGQSNTASGGRSTVTGGRNNTASSSHATVGGGGQNTASGEHSTVGAGQYNDAQARFATIAGGGPADTSNPNSTNNVVYDDYGTIGGGGGNQAGTDDGDPGSARFATVGGGIDNNASNFGATVAGGVDNTASGLEATVGGGFENTASGDSSTVPGGNSGTAADAYSFVWNDGSIYHDTDGNGSFDGLSSSQNIAGSGVTGDQTFHASAQGGFRFITGLSTVTYISGGSTGWATTSTRAAKTNIDPVDPQDVLTGVEEMEVSTWEYKDEDDKGQGVRHIGPMAEEFHTAFDVGASDTGINSINADGVAFAAIQGLSQQLKEKDDRIEELETENEQLDERLSSLEDRIADVEAGDSAATAADD